MTAVTLTCPAHGCGALVTLIPATDGWVAGRCPSCGRSYADRTADRQVVDVAPCPRHHARMDSLTMFAFGAAAGLWMSRRRIAARLHTRRMRRRTRTVHGPVLARGNVVPLPRREPDPPPTPQMEPRRGGTVAVLPDIRHPN